MPPYFRWIANISILALEPPAADLWLHWRETRGRTFSRQGWRAYRAATGINHTLQSCRLVMHAYAVTCLYNKPREENYRSCSACGANMELFVCHWDLSVCSCRSLPSEFKISGWPFCKVATAVCSSKVELLQLLYILGQLLGSDIQFSPNDRGILALAANMYQMIMFVSCTVFGL